MCPVIFMPTCSETPRGKDCARAAPHVVNHQAPEPGLCAGSFPDLSEVANLNAVVVKDVSAIKAAHFGLSLDDVKQPTGKR